MPTLKLPHRRLLAIEDVAGHSNHIAEHNLEAALRFLDAIESSCCASSQRLGEWSRLHAPKRRGFVQSWLLNLVTTWFSIS